SRFVVFLCNNTSVPFKAPNVLDMFNKLASTTVTIIPVFQTGSPKGNILLTTSSLLCVTLSSLGNSNTYKPQPKTIPIKRAYLLIFGGDLILIIITINAIKMDNAATGRLITT